MNRLVGISGLTISENGAKRIEAELEQVYRDADIFTLAEVLNDPTPFSKAAKGKDVDVISDSMGGRMVLREGRKSGIRPGRILTFGTPLPNSWFHYVKGAVSILKEDMDDSPEDAVDARGDPKAPRFVVAARAVREFMRSPVGHAAEVASLNHDPIEDAVAAVQNNIKVSMVYYDRDHYSSPSPEQTQRAEGSGVEFFVTEGDHMSFMRHPARELGKFALASQNFAYLRPRVSSIVGQQEIRSVQAPSLSLIPSEQPAT